MWYQTADFKTQKAFASKWHPRFGVILSQCVGLSAALKPCTPNKGFYFSGAKGKAQDVLFSNSTHLQLLTLLWSCLPWQCTSNSVRAVILVCCASTELSRCTKFSRPTVSFSWGHYHFVSNLSANSRLVSRASCRFLMEH